MEILNTLIETKAIYAIVPALFIVGKFIHCRVTDGKIA
jgi:hypothetical protein